MSELWTVECQAKNDREAVLEFRQCHPDSGELFSSANFVLRALGDHSDECETLAEAVGEDWFEDEWLTAHAPDFIEKISFTLERKSIEMSAMEELREKTGDDVAYESVGATGTYRVTFSDAKWIDGLKKGASWESAAYSNAVVYAGKVLRAEGDEIGIELRQSSADISAFPSDPVFAARALFAGPLDCAENGPDFVQLLDLEFMRQHIAEYIATVQVDVKHAPITLEALSKAKRQFDPEAGDVGVAIYKVKLGSACKEAIAETSVEADAEFTVDPRFTSLEKPSAAASRFSSRLRRRASRG